MRSLTTEILKIIRDKDDYKNKVEIKENAKGEACITVTSRGEDMDEVIKRALDTYKSTKDGLK